MNKTVNFLALVLIIVLCAFAYSTSAQEGTPEPVVVVESPATDSTPLDYADFAKLGGVAALVFLAMEIAKRSPYLRDFDPFKLSASLTLILYVGYQIVFIYGGDAGAYLGYLADIGRFGGSAWDLFLSFSGATGAYHVMKNGQALLPAKTNAPQQDL